MLFNSLSYLLFFPAVVLLYYVIPWQRARNGMLLVASYYFYMCWDPRFILLMLGCTVITYLCGRFVDIAQREEAAGVAPEKRHTGRAALYTAVTLVFMLAVLAWFKYANFLTETLAALLGAVGVRWEVPHFNVALPVGISFFTFQLIAYLVACYRSEMKQYDFVNYLLFITFFPQLIVGPIIHHAEVVPQFENEKNLRLNFDHIALGLFLFSIGCAKKILLADPMTTDAEKFFKFTLAFAARNL